MRRRRETLTLYARPGCCLCETAETALRRAQRRGRFALVMVDISASTDLTERFGDRIPVVALGPAILAEGKVSEFRVLAALRALRAPSGQKNAQRARD